ncbi:hypothetical protein DPMN_108676 [Dreissena polymorpha]|uniref:Uncharacterized protein n=1 Tax=Dreissena polymorpha TaxID=45954 RepID=A0A9D4K8Y3_DREPO|nr:hypothetical protein DPMN_108676 [Dreissena polymorpha]
MGSRGNSDSVDRGIHYYAPQERRPPFLLQLPKNHAVVHPRKGVSSHPAEPNEPVDPHLRDQKAFEKRGSCADQIVTPVCQLHRL